MYLIKKSGGYPQTIKISRPSIKLILYLVSLGTLLLIVSVANAQKPYFSIRSIKTNQTTKVRKGQFIQCIQKNSFDQEEFFFGEVVTIRHDGVMLRNNPFIPGSGGFVFYEDIASIDKIKILKRAILPACIAGIVLGKLSVSFQLTKRFTVPLMGVATYYAMVRSLKRKRKSLFENRIPDAVILIPPGVDVQNDGYFEPSSSSLNHPE